MKFYLNSERCMASQRNACIRCGGYLVQEDFVDLGGTCEPLMTVACRCMNCGNVVDELIIHHQKRDHTECMVPRSFIWIPEIFVSQDPSPAAWPSGWTIS